MRAWLAIAILAGFLVVQGSAFKITALEIVHGRSGALLYRQTVQPGEKFHLVFTHSVSRQQVVEIYEIRPDGRLAVVEMDFDTNGPNLPAGPEGTTRWIIEKNRFRVTGYELTLEEISLFVGQVVANHRLIIGNKEVSLQEVAGPGEYVKIKAACSPLAEHVWKEAQLWLYRKLKPVRKEYCRNTTASRHTGGYRGHWREQCPLYASSGLFFSCIRQPLGFSRQRYNGHRTSALPLC
ncbi:DUF1850 domain-containing protein [Desulfovirgula thermocuniculi]|uniref:DUF1850 domain-containing protein n=1 Tax=Desulfovirgula thermocuniculi TaxID=348842 RepID=UPI0004064250|nr:DUF1850 domain-containing protein [Desulfovirgula thermocuniculi]